MTASADPFLWFLQAHQVPIPLTEFQFSPTRKWLADYCWPGVLIVEREGGLFSKGRAGMAHAKPTAILRDMERSNAAQLLGYVYLRFTPQQLLSETALTPIKQILARVTLHRESRLA